MFIERNRKFDAIVLMIGLRSVRGDVLILGQISKNIDYMG